MLRYHFMVNAFSAGTIVAPLAAVAGWFMVLRREAFAGHTLAVAGFPGATAASWAGTNPAWGFFGFSAAAALLIAALGSGGSGTRRDESAGVAMVQVLALAAGLGFASLQAGFSTVASATLFGSFLGITDAQVAVLGCAGLGAAAALAVIGRPLLLASIDPDLARAKGVPVRLLASLFLGVLSLVVASASQITGALLVFALLVMPAGAARALTARPVVGLLLAVGLSLGITWGALTIGYYSPYPIGFWITSLAFGAFLCANLVGRGAPALLVPLRRRREP